MSGNSNPYKISGLCRKKCGDKAGKRGGQGTSSSRETRMLWSTFHYPRVDSREDEESEGEEVLELQDTDEQMAVAEDGDGK